MLTQNASSEKQSVRRGAKSVSEEGKVDTAFRIVAVKFAYPPLCHALLLPLIDRDPVLSN